MGYLPTPSIVENQDTAIGGRCDGGSLQGTYQTGRSGNIGSQRCSGFKKKPRLLSIVDGDFSDGLAGI